MTPSMITAIAFLLTEALLAGVEMSALISGIKATGRISDDQWAKILNDLDAAKADWDDA